jgi:arylsulfatase A-like enzyme
LGFEWFFGISASLDMWPFAYIENDRFTAPLTVEKQWIRRGPAAADFEAIEVLPTLVRKAVDFIASQADGNAANRRPFFLYLSLTSPHTPIVPKEPWRGRSGLNEYGDFVMQTDAAVGEVLAALEKAGLERNTLVVVTSDNGCSPAAGVEQLEKLGHYPSGPLRGYKADIWEGGHRVPFIVRWPARVRAGSRSGQLVCLNDLLATCAELLGEQLPDDAGEDSFSFLPAMLQRKPAPGRPARDAVVLHSVSGRFAIRQGRWVLALCPGSGGWSRPRDAEAAKQGLPAVQLYDLEADLGQQKNVAEGNPEVVARLRALLEKYVTEGRSTPGKPQRNDVPVQIESSKEK